MTELPTADPTGLVTMQALKSIMGSTMAISKMLRIYYRVPNGEIHIDSADDSSMLRRFKEGAVPLLQYGQFDFNGYVLEHPYEPLFMHGGAHELAPRDVIAMGLHLNPPLVPTCGISIGMPTPSGQVHVRHTPSCWQGAKRVEFPQLSKEERNRGPFACAHCGIDDFVSEAARDGHVRVMHSEKAGEARLIAAVTALAELAAQRK